MFGSNIKKLRLSGGHKNVGASKPMFNRRVKQLLTGHKMSSHHTISSSSRGSSRKSSSISPSVDEFDKMMSSVSGKSSKKKSMFSKRS